jgi:hypothetical protein
MSRDCNAPGCAPYPAPQGAFICKNCQQALKRDLGDIPALIDDLHTTLSRQDAVGASSGRRASESSLPWKEAAAEALWVLVHTVTSAVREFHDADVPFPDAPAAGARWLLLNASYVATHPESGRVVGEISSAVGKGYEAIDRPPDRLLAGQCSADTEKGECTEFLYAQLDSDGNAVRITQCRACGTEHRTEDRRARMVAYASEMQLPAFMALKWTLLLMGKAIPRGTWDGWVARGRVAAIAHDHVGNPLYRFGDVRDLAADWVARPRKDKAA